MTPPEPTPTLAETLGRLAKLIPSRVQRQDNDGDGCLEAYFSEEWWPVYWEQGNSGDPEDAAKLLVLEAALREECDERGWPWRAENGWIRGEYRASVKHRNLPFKPGQEFFEDADSPAHALSLALLAALSSPQETP